MDMKTKREMEIERMKKEDQERDAVSYEIDIPPHVCNTDEKLVIDLFLQLHRKAQVYGQQGESQKERHLRKLIRMLNDAFDSYVAEEKHDKNFIKHFGGGNK